VRSALAWATTCWGLVMALSPLLQVRVVVRRRDSTGVSIAWPAVLFVGFVLWLLYGLVIGDVPLIVTNIVSGLVCLFTVVVLLRFRRARRRAEEPR
jgi:MtN3 and saliva related transmembrane protein